MVKVVYEDTMRIISQTDLSNLKNKTLLLTGFNGLIGGAILNLIYVLNKEYAYNTKVIGFSKSPLRDYWSYIPEDRNFFLYARDLFGQNAQLEVNFDYFIHASTYAQPAKFLEDKLSTIALNTVVLKNILDLAEQSSASGLFVSSSEIYGEPDINNIPTGETYNGNVSTTGVRAPYYESKRLGETICHIYRQDKNLDVKIARVSSIYGPGISVADKRVLGDLIRKALFEKRITLMDAGTQQRVWCYVSDCLIMMLNVLLNGRELIYNVAGKSKVSIKELAEKVGEITRVPVDIPESKGIFMSNAPSTVELCTDRYFSEFPDIDYISLEDGLKNTIDWNKAVLKIGG